MIKINTYTQNACIRLILTKLVKIEAMPLFQANINICAGIKNARNIINTTVNNEKSKLFFIFCC